MSLPWPCIRFLQRAVHLWLFGYLVSAWPAAEWLWGSPVVPPLPVPPGLLSPLTHSFGTWLPQEFIIPSAIALTLLSFRGALWRSYGWVTFIEWVLFSSLVNRSWLAATGGHQLMTNVLFWMVFLPSKDPGGHGGAANPFVGVLHASAFWIIRLQLLLAYGVTGVQKLVGEFWLRGEAVGIVATDADYGPAWLAALPGLTTLVNYGVLGFQLTFPLAMCWRAARPWWFVLGAIFHVATGLAFGILDMGLAFIAVYPIWLDPSAIIELGSRIKLGMRRLASA